NHQKTVMKDDNLQSIAKKLVAPGKGILAADESTGTIEKRLKSINVPSTEENRRAYREILFTTKDAGEFISGVILFDETIRQKTSDGRTFANAEALARYAALCQEGDLVPIVEPEVLMDGTHTIERYFEVTQQTLESVFHVLYEHRVGLEGMLLKPNMVLSGKDCPQQASVQEVAEATVRCMKRVVPAAVPGLVFLSGGQSDLQATEHLNAMNQLPDLPWQLSFSFGRALQAPVLKAWKGDPTKVGEAQQAFHHRALCNSKARFGEYTEQMETAKAA